MDSVIQKSVPQSAATDKKSLNTQFFSPNSTNYSGANSTQMNWMKQKIGQVTDRLQDIQSLSVLETPKESSIVKEQQNVSQAKTLLSKKQQSKINPPQQQKQPSRPLTREEEYQQYPALKYRDYAASNSYIKFTNYRASLINNNNSMKNCENQAPSTPFNNSSRGNNNLGFQKHSNDTNRNKVKQAKPNKKEQQLQSGNLRIHSQLTPSQTEKVFQFPQSKNIEQDKLKQSNGFNSTFQTNTRAASSGGSDVFNVTRPYFLNSRGQLNSQQKEFQTDQVSFVPGFSATSSSSRSIQIVKRNKTKSPQNQNEENKQKFYMSRTRYRGETKKGNDDQSKFSNTINSFKPKGKHARSSTAMTMTNGVKAGQNELNQNEDYLSDTDIKLMMIATGIQPMMNVFQRRAKFGCKSIYNPDQLSHFERINSKNYFLAGLDPFKPGKQKFQTSKDVADYYHHLERYDQQGQDEYFIETREKATNYNRFHMSKPNIRMQYEQQLKIANLLINQVKQEKSVHIQRSFSPSMVSEEKGQIHNNNTVHVLHKYLLAKDLIKETWKQLSQPETPNPNQIVKLLNGQTVAHVGLNSNNSPSKQTFTALLKDQDIHKDFAANSQPISMNNIDEPSHATKQNVSLHNSSRKKTNHDPAIDKHSQNAQTNNSNYTFANYHSATQSNDMDSQFKFQQFVIDEGLQEMNHYEEIVRQYKQKYTELNKFNKDKIQKDERINTSPQKSMNRSVSAGKIQTQLNPIDINKQVLNFPTELNVYTREDIFIKRVIDKMINNDEIDLVSLHEISQLQQIIEQRQSILKELKLVIIKSINEILQAKFDQRKRKHEQLQKQNQQQFQEQKNILNNRLNTENNKQKQKLIRQQSVPVGGRRQVKTSQQEKRQKLIKQNSLGYKDYVQSKVHKQFVSKKNGQQSFITGINFDRFSPFKYTNYNNNNNEAGLLNLYQNNDEIKGYKDDLFELKNNLTDSQSLSPKQQRIVVDQSEFKNITELLDPAKKNPYYEMQFENNENQNQQKLNQMANKKNQYDNQIINEDENEYDMNKHSELDLKSQQQYQDSKMKNPKQSSQQISFQNLFNIDTNTFIDDQNQILEINGKQLSLGTQNNESQDKFSLNLIKEESLQSPTKLKQKRSSKSQKSQELMSPEQKKQNKSNVSRREIQPLVEEFDENETPSISDKDIGIYEDNETLENEDDQEFIQNKNQYGSEIEKGPQNYNEITGQSKFNPNSSQRSSINLPVPQYNLFQNSNNNIPSLQNAESLLNIKESSLAETDQKGNVDSQEQSQTSLALIENKRQRDIKKSQQNLMTALKQAEMNQKSRNSIPSLLELPKQQKNYVTYSIIEQSPSISPSISPNKQQLTSRSNIDSPQIGQSDTQRSILNKTEVEKEKLQILMNQQHRLSKQQTIKSSTRLHSDQSKNVNITIQKATLASQFNTFQEFNHAETEAINKRNVKITERFEKADKVIATKATLNKPEGYNLFINEEEVEQIQEKLNKSRNSNASEDSVSPFFNLLPLKERPLNSDDNEENENLSNILEDKISEQDGDTPRHIEEEDEEYMENSPVYKVKTEQSDGKTSGKQKDTTQVTQLNNDGNKQNDLAPPVRHQVRFEVVEEKLETIISSRSDEDQQQSLNHLNNDSQTFNDSKGQVQRQLSKQLSKQLSRQLSRGQSGIIKDEPKSKIVKKAEKQNKSFKKKANLVKSISGAFDLNMKKSESSIVKHSETNISEFLAPQTLQSRQPSLAYLDDNFGKTLSSQHNIPDIQKLVSDKFKNKKSMVQGFSGASLYKIMTESFVELEEQANQIKEDVGTLSSKVFGTKKSLSNIQSKSKLVKTKSFKNLSTKNVFKQNAINEILNQYKINERMTLIEKRRIIEMLVNKLEAKADIDDDQNFNSILYKQVQEELKFISQNENDTNQQILEAKPSLTEEKALFDSIIDQKKKDMQRGKLKFSENIILNQKNNLLDEVNQEDLDMDNDLMDMIQKLVKQNEDMDEEYERKRLFKLQTKALQRTLQQKQGIGPVVETAYQIPIQDCDQDNDKNKKRKRYDDKGNVFRKQPTRYLYNSSNELSKEEIEMLKKLEKLKQKFNYALTNMGKEEKMLLRDQYLLIKTRAESR